MILRRRAGEAIIVAGDVEIEVIEISRAKVKLGVRAPAHVTVIRKETLAVAQENRLASALISRNGTQLLDELVQLLQMTGKRCETGITEVGPCAIAEEREPSSAQRRVDTADM